MSKTSIEWTNYSWNPIRGTKGKWHCTKVSPGCTNCYAERMNIRFKGPAYTVAADALRLDERALNEPLHWRKPRKVFACSMTDLFHEQVPRQWVHSIFVTIAWTPRHTYQILTKRPKRALDILGDWQRVGLTLREGLTGSPLPNVWLGVSAEDQQRANERIPILLQTPAAVRFVSLEPLLAPVNLSGVIGKLGWIIVGGESGPGARPMHPGWVRSIRDQCRAAGVPLFLKQWGEYAYANIEDDPGFAGGRAFNDPFGGRSAAQIRMRSTKPFTSGKFRQMEPGDEKSRHLVLDENTIAARVGKKRAGAMLDGELIQEFPT